MKSRKNLKRRSESTRQASATEEADSSLSKSERYNGGGIGVCPAIRDRLDYKG
jgi:hypothetical protein